MALLSRLRSSSREALRSRCGARAAAGSVARRDSEGADVTRPGSRSTRRSAAREKPGAPFATRVARLPVRRSRSAKRVALAVRRSAAHDQPDALDRRRSFSRATCRRARRGVRGGAPFAGRMKGAFHSLLVALERAHGDRVRPWGQRPARGRGWSTNASTARTRRDPRRRRSWLERFTEGGHGFRSPDVGASATTASLARSAWPRRYGDDTGEQRRLGKGGPLAGLVVSAVQRSSSDVDDAWLDQVNRQRRSRSR